RAASRPHGPHRLVRDDQSADLIGGQAVEARLDLAIEYAERLVAIALFKGFADADDRRELGCERRAELAIDGLVGLSEQTAPLRVPDDHVFGARLLQHCGADLAGE